MVINKTLKTILDIGIKQIKEVCGMGLIENKDIVYVSRWYMPGSNMRVKTTSEAQAKMLEDVVMATGQAPNMEFHLHPWAFLPEFSHTDDKNHIDFIRKIKVNTPFYFLVFSSLHACRMRIVIRDENGISFSEQWYTTYKEIENDNKLFALQQARKSYSVKINRTI